MNPQTELMTDVMHVLAQPVTALRAALELALRDHADHPTAQKTFEDCLGLVDRLAHELALFREIAGLETEPPLEICDGEALLKSSVEEMAPVAESCGVALHLNAERSAIQCNAAMLQRALFLLLDEMIAGSPGGGVSIGFWRQASEVRLEMRPGIAPGRRQQLCRKLIEFAGGRDLEFDGGRTYCCFRNGEHLQNGLEAAAD